MSNVKCASCNGQRNELKDVPSKLLPGMQFLMCNDCISKGWEPRWAVIMANQQFGNGAVKPFVTNHLYAGNQITLEEVI